MDQIYPIHQFAEGAATQVPGISSQDCQLIVVQEPIICKVSVGKEKDRKPVDPPPVVQLKVSPLADPNQNYLQSSHFFLTCSLLGSQTPALSGTVVSSLHRLKDLDNKEGAFFVFGDVSIKVEGTYQLQFDLYEMQEAEQCVHICTTMSQPFPVVSSKNFNGMPESTGLTRTFSEQGVRLRLRKEPRSLLKSKGPATDDYKPRQYRTNARTQSSHSESLPSPVSSNGSHFAPSLALEHQDPQLQNTYIQQMKNTSRSYTAINDHSPVVSPNYDDRRIKRPRTGSEHSQLQPYALQTHGFDNTSYQTMPNFSANSMTGFTPLQQQYGGIAYTTPSYRSSYTTVRGNGQRSFSYGDLNGSYSSDSARFSQSQVIPSQPHYLDTMAHERQHDETVYTPTDFVTKSYSPQHMTVVPVIPSDWRSTTDPAYQAVPGTTTSDDRQIYSVYPSQSFNVSSA